MSYRERDYTPAERAVHDEAEEKLKAYVRGVRERGGWKVCEVCGVLGCTPWGPPKPCSAWSSAKQPHVSVAGEEFDELHRVAAEAAKPGIVEIEFAPRPVPQTAVTPLSNLFVPQGAMVHLTIVPEMRTSQPFSAVLVGHPA